MTDVGHDGEECIPALANDNRGKLYGCGDDGREGDDEGVRVAQ